MTWIVVVQNKMNFKVVDTIDEGNEFDYLRPKGRLTLKMDSIYSVPKIDSLFDDWYANSVSLWPKTKKVSKHFLQLERTPSNSPPISSFEESSDNVSLDTIHWKNAGKNFNVWLLCKTFSWRRQWICEKTLLFLLSP